MTEQKQTKTYRYRIDILYSCFATCTAIVFAIETCRFSQENKVIVQSSISEIEILNQGFGTSSPLSSLGAATIDNTMNAFFNLCWFSLISPLCTCYARIYRQDLSSVKRGLLRPVPALLSGSICQPLFLSCDRNSFFHTHCVQTRTHVIWCKSLEVPRLQCGQGIEGP